MILAINWFCGPPDLDEYKLTYNNKRLTDGAPLLKQSYVFDSLKYSAHNYLFRYKSDAELGHTLKSIYLFDCIDLKNGETDVYNLSADSSISIRYTHLTGNLKYELWLKSTENISDTFFEINQIDAQRLIGLEDYQELFNE